MDKQAAALGQNGLNGLKMAESFIQVENLTKTYKRGRFKAVDQVSFSVEEGEVFGLIGPNGAGKTTIMGCLLALLNPDSGKITVNGHSPFDSEVKQITGFLPERPCYDRWMTVDRFLEYHQMLAGRPPAECKSDIARVLERVELDSSVRDRKIKQLSRGMLQRLGLAQALLGNPRVCFLDEPTSGLDPLGFLLIRRFLLQCKEEGITVVVNSHHLHEVEMVCDRVAFIQKGKIKTIQSLKTGLDKQEMLTVRWAGSRARHIIEPQLLASVSGSSSSLIEFHDRQASFSVDDEAAASAILSKLLQEGFTVFEARFEKRSLVELFLDDEEEEPGSDQ